MEYSKTVKEKKREQLNRETMSCMTPSEQSNRALQWTRGLSDVSGRCRTRFLLLTLGPSEWLRHQKCAFSTCINTHSTLPPLPPHTHKIHFAAKWTEQLKPLQGSHIIHPRRVSCHCWQADINIPQPFHKRVNGCPSGSNETHRTACDTQYGRFHSTSKVTYRDWGEKKTLGDRKLWQGRLNTFHALVFLQEHTNNSPQQGGGVGGVTLQFCSSYILKSIV